MCVVGGWFEQSHMAHVRLIRLWGWVRLNTCSALDKPSHRLNQQSPLKLDRSLTWQHETPALQDYNKIQPLQ